MSFEIKEHRTKNIELRTVLQPPEASDTQSNTESGNLVFIEAPHKIEPGNFEDVLKTGENFNVFLIAVYVQRVGASYQVPVGLAKTGDLIGEQAIEMMFNMPFCIQAVFIAVFVIR